MSRMVGKFKGRRGVLRGLLKDARSIDLWSRSFTQLDDASLKKRMADMQAELKTLRRDKDISSYMADYISLGYDNDLAKETAEAMADGNFEKVFANQKKFKSNFEKQIRTEILGDTPRPDGTGGQKNYTKAEFLKLPYEKQLEYIKDHPNYQSELK